MEKSMLDDESLQTYLTKIKLPNPTLSNSSDIARDFLKIGIADLYHAIEYIHHLPYRRISDFSDYRLVLGEECGTCTPKHAVLAELAATLHIPLQLKVAAVFMNSKNAPKIAKVLKQYQLNHMLETHSYLEYAEKPLDITFPDNNSYKMPYPIIKEVTVLPKDLSEFKMRWHQEMLKKWRTDEALHYSEDELWKIRELCIDALCA